MPNANTSDEAARRERQITLPSVLRHLAVAAMKLAVTGLASRGIGIDTRDHVDVESTRLIRTTAKYLASWFEAIDHSYWHQSPTPHAETLPFEHASQHHVVDVTRHNAN